MGVHFKKFHITCSCLNSNLMQSLFFYLIKISAVVSARDLSSTTVTSYLRTDIKLLRRPLNGYLKLQFNISFFEYYFFLYKSVERKSNTCLVWFICVRLDKLKTLCYLQIGPTLIEILWSVLAYHLGFRHYVFRFCCPSVLMKHRFNHDSVLLFNLLLYNISSTVRVEVQQC